MQVEKINQKRSYISRYVDEDEDFWRKHFMSYSNSGMTKTAYCKANQINYDRFYYWIRKSSGTLKNPTASQHAKKQSSMTSDRLLPIQLTHDRTPQDGVLSSVILKNGCTLRIHDQQSLMHILAAWS